MAGSPTRSGSAGATAPTRSSSIPSLPRAPRGAGPAPAQEARQLLRRVRLGGFLPQPRRAAARRAGGGWRNGGSAAAVRPPASGPQAGPDPEPPPPPASASEPRSAPTRLRHRTVPHAPLQRRRRYYFGAELLHRVFLCNALICPHCGGPRRLLAFVSDQTAIARILLHIGLPTEAPELAPARPPPEPSVRFLRS